MILRIPRLKHAIAAEHNCRAEHVSSRIIVEHAPDGTVWRGRVDTFDVTGHAQADRCYAWVEEIDGRSVCTTVLRSPPVKSVQGAVRAALATRRTTAKV